MRTIRCGCLALMLLAAPAGAAILYDAGAGFRTPGFNLLEQGIEPQKAEVTEFSFGGALCPAAGTPDFLCGSVLSEATIEGGRLLLRSKARFKRTNASSSTHPETAAYADTRITVTEIGGYAATAPKAVFYFGMSGTLEKAGGAAGVTLQAFSRATLSAGSTNSAQCFGLEVSCLPTPEPYTVLVEDFNPTLGFALMLRSDVAAVGFGVADGWDAEVVADFADTLEVLAIELQDENGVPIPGVTLTATDGMGNTVAIPSVPAPEPGAALLLATGAAVLTAARRRSRASGSAPR
jgi:hypothetical protein